jgi:hypothetical protein
MAALKWKPKEQQVRLIWSDGPGRVDSVEKNPGKVFAVIGPFENHAQPPELMNALEMLVRGYNLEE